MPSPANPVSFKKSLLLFSIIPGFDELKKVLPGYR